MKIGSVYLITNTVNGKKYVGCTIRPVQQRFIEHINGGHQAARLLHNAIVEFGSNKFSIKTLFRGSWSKALQVERKLTAKYDAYQPNGYNLFGTVGYYRHSVETRRKISLAKTGVSVPHARGYHLSEETRRKMSLSHIGKPGTKHTAESKAKLRLAHLGKPNPYKRSEAAKIRVSLSMMGNTIWVRRKHSEETKAKMSLARAAYWERKPR